MRKNKQNINIKNSGFVAITTVFFISIALYLLIIFPFFDAITMQNYSNLAQDRFQKEYDQKSAQSLEDLENFSFIL